ncbi:hypothetical protein S7711_07373 [Stachybotrys chartarum IBT 7711]|uniref:F-box domain-containing protein n=1 Tax=Stachybotrys chartarum (strain CBS 109288 / IBT 7711) TaxID=1280523 RepID=A0A084AIA9_STACB|nr:hypothetical protein S7711_07373 [Stachybotrys chartarum IBT 7711]
MVQLQMLPESPYSPSGTIFHQTEYNWGTKLDQNDVNQAMSREEHAQRMKELVMKRGIRAPRRGWSMTDYQSDNAVQPPSNSAASHVSHEAAIPENEPLSASSGTPSPTTEVVNAGPRAEPVKQQVVQLPQRPKLPPPRRSYSVMDYEPAPPGLPKPSARLGLLNLPSELHYAFFDFLDPIDGACFGLAHSNLYAIHKRKNGKVPLSSRYSGPNDMEWAWRGAGPAPRPAVPAGIKEKELEQLRVKGQVYCRKCGISRCELHRHLKSWMGEGYEYCAIKQIYGKPAGEDAKPYCFMSSPKNPHRCGRHGRRQRLLA